MVTKTSTLEEIYVPAVHGECVDCGETIRATESFLRVKEGEYVCTGCLSNRCVVCAGEVDTRTEEGDEAVCSGCQYNIKHRADIRYAEIQYAFYNEKRPL